MNRTCNFLAALVFSGVLATAALAGLPTPPEPWDAGGTGYEDDPVSTDPVAGGDDHLRGVKEEVRTRLNVEHQFGNITNMNAVSYDNGLHRLGSARCFIRDDSPDSLCGDVGAGENCGDHPNTSGPSQVTTLSAVGSQSDPNDIGHGRCWIDVDGPDNVDNTADDFTLMVFDENTASGSWVRANTTRDRLLHNGPNLLYNGDFEIEGDGSTALPDGWTAVDGGAVSGGPTYDVNPTDAAQGAGLDVEVTADADIALGNDAINQVLNGLKGATTYVFTARVFTVGADDICTIDVSGEDTKTLPTSTTLFQAWETVTGTFVTDATPAAITVSLENDDTDAGTGCIWDRVSVYEQQIESMGNNRGFLWTLSSSSTESDGLDADFTFDDLLSPVFDISGDNCYAKATYDFGWTATDVDDADDAWDFVLRLQYDNGSGFVDIDEGWATDIDYGGTDDTPLSDPSNNSGRQSWMTGYGANSESAVADVLNNLRTRLSGAVTNLTAGAVLQFRVYADINNVGSAADTLVLDPTWRTAAGGALTSSAQTKEHRAWVEVVCH